MATTFVDDDHHQSILQKMTGEAQNRSSVVLYPSPGMGHLVSMFELAKLFISHNFSVTILIVETPYTAAATSPFISRVSASNPSISFHRLPSTTPPPTSSPHHEALFLGHLLLSNPGLLAFFRSSPAPPSALVIDSFCACALDVSTELEIPTYFFMTSSASSLSTDLHFPELHARTAASFREMGSTNLYFPGLPPLPADHMPLPQLDRDDEAYKGLLDVARRMPKARGIIVNTVDALEARAIEGINAAGSFPPLHCIGPFITNFEGMAKTTSKETECLVWLDKQAKGSVVFLCFGSMGWFSAEQVREIAVGLEKSGQRFLWVVRSPAGEEPDMGRLMPQGFLSRTKERGKVVKSWAPQAAVLKHESVGGFVTHCGWNSILEAICGGVPMIGWPLYAEQKMNLVVLVEEMMLAVKMEGYDKEMVISAEEVEKKIRWLMESEGGRELKVRVAAAKECAEAAWKSGGSSEIAWRKLMSALKA